MNIRKFIKYAVFDTLTIFLPIIIGCGLNVEYSSVIVIGVLTRATIGAIGNDNVPPKQPEMIGEIT